MDSAEGVVKFELPFVVPPGEERLTTLGQKALREQSSLDILGKLRKRLMKSSGDETVPGREHKYKLVEIKQSGRWVIGRVERQPRIIDGSCVEGDSA